MAREKGVISLHLITVPYGYLRLVWEGVPHTYQGDGRCVFLQLEAKWLKTVTVPTRTYSLKIYITSGFFGSAALICLCRLINKQNVAPLALSPPVASSLLLSLRENPQKTPVWEKE